MSRQKKSGIKNTIPCVIIFAFAPMTNFIPIFPLNIVLYPGEELNLHIFEPKYKQLISECLETKKPFGIPTVIKNKVSEMGTLVEIAELKRLYDNGEMDIKTRGLSVFRILEVVKQIPDKLYQGAIVNYPDQYGNGSRQLMKKVLQAIRQLHKLLKVTKEFGKPDSDLQSYDVAHHAGLSLEQEYELLTFSYELHREEYLKQHLAKVLPVVSEMEHLKKRVKMNGHFKNLGGFDI